MSRFNGRPASFLWLAVLLACACLAAHGCQTGQAGQLQRAADSGQVFNGTIRTILDLRKAGKIDDATYRKVYGYRVVAEDALRAYEDAALAGEPFGAARAERAFQAALIELVRQRITAERNVSP